MDCEINKHTLHAPQVHTLTNKRTQGLVGEKNAGAGGYGNITPAEILALVRTPRTVAQAHVCRHTPHTHGHMK